MCTRYLSPDQAAIERFWQIGRSQPWRWPDEVFPGAAAPFIRRGRAAAERELVLGRWGLIPWFAKTARLTYSTHNARFEEIAAKASFKESWRRGKRCLIPARSFDEPCWETGRNVWWRFRRADGALWALAGLWNEWTDPESGEVIASYTMLTTNADAHPLFSRMHKPDPKLPPGSQDKRCPVAIEAADVEIWLGGSIDQAARLVHMPPPELTDGAPAA